MSKKIDPIEKSIPEQEWTRYNRESGKKTLALVATMISAVVLLIVIAAILFFKRV